MHTLMFQDINNPSYSVMMLIAIYANVALKQISTSHEDQVMITRLGLLATCLIYVLG